MLPDEDSFVMHDLSGRMRHTWADKWDFVLTAAGFTLGLNNLWRFPYFCYQNEGGSFLLAYLILMLFCGIPILCMEYAIGQLTQKGQAAFANFCPILKGFVVSCLCACIFIIFIYTSINCWSIFYLFKSLFNLPTWSQCKNGWNSKYCLVQGPFPNATQLILEKYKNYLLNNKQHLLASSSLLGTAAATSAAAGVVTLAPSLSSTIGNLTWRNQLNSTTANTAVHQLMHNPESALTSTTLTGSLPEKSFFEQLINGNFSGLNSLNLNAIPNVQNFSNLPYLINLASNLTAPINETNTRNEFMYNSSYYATQEFYDFKLHALNLGFNSLGIIKWEFAIPLFIIWITIFICLRKHLTFSRHSTNCLAIIPFAFILILVFRALMLPGADIGIQYFLTPTWQGIVKPQVWLFAAGLCFHSIGSILGTSISMAKCNKESNHFIKDALFVCLLNVFTVFLIGFIVFSTLGYLSRQRNLDITEVILSGPSLPFVAFSEFLMTMPFPTLWAAAFFLLLFFVGTDYQIGVAVTLLTTIEDLWGSVIRRNFFSKQLFILLICSTLLVLNSFFITQKALLLIVSIDTYISVWLTLILAIIEVIIVGWFYGGKNFANIIKQKASKKLGFYFPFCWTYLTPLILITILTWNVYFFETITFRTLQNSVFLRLGQLLAIISLLFIPIYAIVVFRKIDPENSFLGKLVIACRPNLKWFTESELLYNEKYNTNLEDYLEKANRYNHLRLNGNTIRNNNGSNNNNNRLNAQPEMLSGKRDSEHVQSNLLNQSKITYSIVQNLDKETTL